MIFVDIFLNAVDVLIKKSPEYIIDWQKFMSVASCAHMNLVCKEDELTVTHSAAIMIIVLVF